MLSQQKMDDSETDEDWDEKVCDHQETFLLHDLTGEESLAPIWQKWGWKNLETRIQVGQLFDIIFRSWENVKRTQVPVRKKEKEREKNPREIFYCPIAYFFTDGWQAVEPSRESKLIWSLRWTKIWSLRWNITKLNKNCFYQYHNYHYFIPSYA